MADTAFSIRGEATLDTSGLQGSLGTITSAAGKALSGLTKAAAGAMAAGATAAAALAKQALSSYATHEQAIGGVETLYKTSADTVIRYAENAYKTAGMSANDYMNTVTSFAASLVSSLGGGTAQAAELANMAITDMADNANKMGTAMQSIQDAYQGFAKQNYTMLDNLKLGYGGTQAEMQRLLQDAQALSGTHFELGNYADMVQAIHIIQTEMGITGTTAQEAATTIEGSVASLKAAWSNLLTGIADDSANVAALVDTLAETFATAAGNILPRLVQIFEGMGDAVTAAAPAIAAQIPPMVESLLPSFLTAATALAASIAAQLPSILEAVVTSVTQVMADTGAQAAYQLVTGFSAQLPTLITAGLNGLASFGDYLTANADTLVGVGVKLLSGLVEGIRDGLPNLLFSAAKLLTAFGKAIVDHLDEIEQLGVDLLYAIIEGIANTIADLGEVVLGVIAYILGLWDGNMDNFGQIGTNAAKSIANGLTSGQVDVQNAAKGVYDAAMRGFSGMAGGQSSGGGAGRGGGARRSLAAHDQSYWEQVAQHFTDTGQDQKNGDYRTKEEKAASDAALATADLTNSLKGLSSAAGSAAKQTETLADKITKADKALTESQNAYQTLNDAVQEYNDTGTISLSTWQDLIDLAPEYQALLSKQGDQLVIDTAAYNELTAAQRMEIETLVTQNGVTADAIQLIDSLGIAAEDSVNKAGTAFSDLKDKVKELVKDGPLEVITDLAGALKNGDWTDAAAAIAQGLWMTITPEQQDIIYKWATEAIKTMNDGFTKAGWSGLINAGTSVVQGLADSSTDMGGLITGLLNQVGISGGIQGLLSTIADLAPLVLGVAAAAAAVAAGVMGVAAAFKYVISQSQLLQSEVQELADAGQALTDELSDALEVLQPVIDLSEDMLDSLDRLTSTITDTITGIGVELMESLLPLLTEIMDTLTPVAESLQPALEAVGDLLRTLLELFGTLVSSVMTALQPVLEAIGPLIEALAIRLNTIATLVSAILSPALKALGEVLNWLLQPILWVADAIQAAVTFVVDLLNSVLGFLGLKTIDLPDGSAALKGEAFDKVTSALEDNTEAIQEQTDLIRNPPRYQTGGGGPSTGVTDYSAMLAAARAAVLAQNTKTVTNYDAGSGQTTARLNASWRGTSTTVLELDGKEIARATAPYMDEELVF